MFNIGRDGLTKACTAQSGLLEHLQDCYRQESVDSMHVEEGTRLFHQLDAWPHVSLISDIEPMV
jgi:hypothetical protein